MPLPGLPFSLFRAAACVVLGGTIGALIGLPMAITMAAPGSYILVVASTALGIFTGYRRRRSTVFFYFALFCVCVLSLLVTLSGFVQLGP